MVAPFQEEDTMQIGRIIEMPSQYSDFALVRDEYGSTYSVDKGEIKSSASDGDSMAYRVDFFGNHQTTLRSTSK